MCVSKDRTIDNRSIHLLVVDRNLFMCEQMFVTDFANGVRKRDSEVSRQIRKRSRN